MGLRERLMGMADRPRSPGPVSQFEGFRNREGSFNPFSGLQAATAPMANAGMASLNGAPTTTAPTGGAGAGGGAAAALSTGAPIGTMAHDGGGGPFTFGFPFGIDEGAGDSDAESGGGWEPSEAPEETATGEEEDTGSDTGDTGGGDSDSGGGDDDGES